MSAILSTDDLNDFISPSVACVKPVETLPEHLLSDDYEVAIEGPEQQGVRAAQISLTDCLACSGCVTSAEAVLVSLQSHAEVLDTLNSAPGLDINKLNDAKYSGEHQRNGKIFVASVSPQVRASLAATYKVTETAAGMMIQQLLCGRRGLAQRGCYGNSFIWVMDTNRTRDLALAIGSNELIQAIEPLEREQKRGDTFKESSHTKLPLLTSACPGWVCYAEKTHPHVLPHLSKTKSPQAIAGTLFKSVLAKYYNLDPAQIWHLAIMPCFDKKLEASRLELTDVAWRRQSSSDAPVRDVDCVITAREVLMLADSCGIRFSELPQEPHDNHRPFPNPLLEKFLFGSNAKTQEQRSLAGTSGGYLYYMTVMSRDSNPGSTIRIERGRNSDVVEYSVVQGERVIFKGARYYGFRNIQNLVRRLKPSRSRIASSTASKKMAQRAPLPPAKTIDYSYIEVMACPGGCTNGGGQIKVSDLSDLQTPISEQPSQKSWLNQVDKAYYLMDNDSECSVGRHAKSTEVSQIQDSNLQPMSIVKHWSHITGLPNESLVYTSYRQIDSDVGKPKQDAEAVTALASKIGGGW